MPTLARLLAVGTLVLAAPAGAAAAAAPLLDFYPQSGVLWRDLYPNNFVDLDPDQGLLDWNCGALTYDGHTGTDSDLRSFAEKTVGVPVYAALDGRVSSVQDGAPDENRGGANPGPDNHVEIDSPGSVRTIYGHLRRNSITVRVGEEVVAGEQIGQTASSGIGLAALPFDEAQRTGTFVRGRRHFDFRVQLGAAFEARLWSFRILKPDRTVALERSGRVTWRMYHGQGSARWGDGVDFDATGRWELVWELDGRALVTAPFDVVASQADVANRPPNAIAVSFARAPTAGHAAQCVVDTSLVNEDPDYEIVRYRYRWSVGGAVVREATSAGLSDVLRRDALVADRPLTCSVTPSDGRAGGPTATVTAVTR